MGLVVGCAHGVPPPTDTRWVLWHMGVTNGDQWFKRLGDPAGGDAEACRTEVKTKADRMVAGLIGWYPDVSVGRGVYIGCLPAGYDPYERR